MKNNNKQNGNSEIPDDDGKHSEETLGSLRNQIDEKDEQIVSLLKDRQDLVEKVVELKKRHNLPVYHPAREEDLISKRRKQATESGLDPDFIEDLYRAIVRRSRLKQTVRMANSGIRPGAKVLVVGGKGAMGNYFCRWFSRAGYNVRVLDKGNWDDVKTLCEGIDLAIISVPIEKTVEITKKIGPYLPPEAVLSDITSIKRRPLTAMMNAHSGPVIGLHPLFGPSTSTLDKQIVVAVYGRYEPACRWVADQFSAWGSVVVIADADEHDEMMAIVQALRHFATFAFGHFLSKKRIDLFRTLEFSSPIYRLELGMVGRLFAQDPGLYSEIIFASPKRKALLRQYVESINKNLTMIEQGNKERFQKEFKKIAEWFGPFSDQAMRESTYIIDKLIERF